MFAISLSDIEKILNDFGIYSKVVSFAELQRYYYEESNPETKEVRLIVKVDLNDNSAVVIRFKNETDVTLELIEQQSRFALLLKENGIATPVAYQSEQKFAKWYSISKYDTIVTVEEFVNGELSYVDTVIAGKIGRLLAKTHNIAEANKVHIKNGVLFDPFADNDLFNVSDLLSHEKELVGMEDVLYQSIVKKYTEYMKILSCLCDEPRYAVQGDFSQNNLYWSEDQLGIFDFNRCGDNNLFCDAIMQAVFVSRLMDYPENRSENFDKEIMSAFLKNYAAVRPFSDIQKRVFPYLFAIIDAFWSADIVWNENSLLNLLERGENKAVCRRLKEILSRLSNLTPMPI